MDKPITVRIDEFKKTVVNAINEAGLPIQLAQYILRDVLEELVSLRQQVEQNERRAWENNKAEQATDEKKEED